MFDKPAQPQMLQLHTLSLLLMGLVVPLNYEPLSESPRLTFKQQRPHKSWKEQADAAIARKYRLLQLLRKPLAKQQRPHES